MKQKDHIEIFPDTLYIFYRMDARFNRQRLSGEVYFPSPLKFNDLFDSQLSCKNNSDNLTEEDRIRKMKELGFKENEAKKYANDILTCSVDSELFHNVYHRQLEKCGILCLTEDWNNPMMWGHYSRNEGFCIAYETKYFYKYITLGYVNNLSKEYVELFLGNNYDVFPRPNDKDIPKRQEFADKLFSLPDCELINNNYISARLEDSAQKIAFLKNIFCKRIYIRKVEYVDKLDNIRPTLFYDHSNNISKGKYYTKLKCWEYEKEWRVVLSLGGNTSTKLPLSAIKQIILGCNISDISMCEIISIIKDFKDENFNPEIVRITKSGNNLMHNKLDKDEIIHRYKNLIAVFK